MTESDIYPLIATLADGRVYPYVVPLNNDGLPSVSAPYIVFSLISDISSDVLCGQAESTVHIQIDVWATEIDEARSVREQALNMLRVLSPTGVTRIPGYDTVTHLHRATLEITVTD